MDYLMVLFGIASVGALFAGMKTMTAGKTKQVTRLEL
jgi:hypothetical protein